MRIHRRAGRGRGGRRHYHARLHRSVRAPLRGAAATPPHSTGLGAVRPPIKYRDCDDCSLLSRQIAWSLDNQPELWDTNGFHVDRRGGGSMWAANGAAHIELGSGAASTIPDRPDLTPHDQDLLWGAYPRWLECSVTR